MISRSDFESLPESASSLDYNPRGRVQGMVLSGGGDPYLRISRDTGSDILRDAEETGGPDKDLMDQIQRWKEHAQKNKEGAGFRKASRGPVDPRRFALHLSRVALQHAQQHGSRSLLKLSKQLRWAASQSRQVAAEALENMTGENPDEQESVGVSRIEKPGGAPPAAPQWGAPRGQPGRPPAPGGQPGGQPGRQPGRPPGPAPGVRPGAPPDPAPTYPGSMREQDQAPDQYWSSEKTGSRRANDESNSDLIQYALDFLEDYRSTNSLADDQELLDQLNQSEVYESWLVDLDNRGVLADPQDLDEAWNQAISETTNATPEEDNGLPPDIVTSKKTADDSSDPDDPRIQQFLAPGGDWGNTVVRREDTPSLDRTMRDRVGGKKDYNWANRYVEDDYQSGMDHIARRAKSKKHDDDKDDDASDDVKQAADQVLDHLAGEMTPDQISPEDVKQFVENDYPDVDWKAVYKVIEEVTDPKTRHEKERTNEEYRDNRPAQTAHRRLHGPSAHYVSAFDTMESAPSRKHAHLRGHREICACCTGTGQEGAGACSRCQGSGRHGLDPDDAQIDAKARVIDRVGSLLLVEVNPQQLAPKGRHFLSRVTNTRVASGSRVRYTHTPELMSFLAGYDVPFKMVGYTHPNYRPAGRSVST